MRIIENPLEFQREALKLRDSKTKTVLVPTMGALHAGHIKLIQAAREVAGLSGRVIVTIFVNPLQFNSTADLGRYPRTFEQDVDVCRENGVDLIFAPTREAMYPPDFQTHVEVGPMTQVLCGPGRPGHFRGVTTVVMKLLMLAQPNVAIFGWKDAQQFLILRRMVEDLCVPVELIAVDTVREADGLALSSRNGYLNEEERKEAPRIYRGLSAAKHLFDRGEHRAEILLAAARAPIEKCSLFELEYAELRALNNLEALKEAQPGNSLLPVAAKIGPARLIDNVRF